MELALQVQLLLSRELELALPLQWVRVRQPVLLLLAPLPLHRELEPHRLPAILRMAWPRLPQSPLPLCCPRSHQ
jgi:hypothetical protein